jgi:protein ImuA
MLSTTLADTSLPDSLANAHVWRAGELGGASLQTVATGYAGLDHVLPGHGWSQGAMTEVLQPQAGLHEWGLVAPALAKVQADSSPEQTRRMLVLVNPPHLPFGPALGAQQLDLPRMLCVRGATGNAPSLLWATREALQCADVAAVMAWLPDARSAHLRRLQIAAHAHNKLLFVFRPLRAQHESSPAPLRLLLEGAVHADGNLLVHVLKRRGPPLAAPILLDTRPARLSALLAASRERVRRQREDLDENLKKTPPLSLPALATSPQSPVHALLDRLVNVNNVDHLDHH